MTGGGVVVLADGRLHGALLGLLAQVGLFGWHLVYFGSSGVYATATAAGVYGLHVVVVVVVVVAVFVVVIFVVVVVVVVVAIGCLVTPRLLLLLLLLLLAKKRRLSMIVVCGVIAE